jgi:hypothetical protein
MFSGKFVTSIGDTIYQMLVKSVYLMKLLEKYPDDTLLDDIISYGFLIVFFYGDDHIARWPKALNRFLLYSDSKNFLDDFTLFCCREFGMVRKESAFKCTDQLYGKRFFTLVDGVYVEDLDMAEDSPTFLKNTIVEVYFRASSIEEWQCLGRLPYRPTIDFAAKFGYTLSSSSNLKLSIMNLRSQARLASGNLEAYSMASVLHHHIYALVGEPSPSDWDVFVSEVKGNSVRRVASRGPFPEYHELIQIQRDGEQGSGFAPKDMSGNISPFSQLYANNGRGNVQSVSFRNINRDDIYYNYFAHDDELDGGLTNFDSTEVYDYSVFSIS